MNEIIIHQVWGGVNYFYATINSLRSCRGLFNDTSTRANSQRSL